MCLDVKEGRLDGRVIDGEWLRQRYEKDNLSSTAIAAILGCQPGTILVAMRKHGIKAKGPSDSKTKSRHTKPCIQCGTVFSYGGAGNPRQSKKFCSNRCSGLSQDPATRGSSAPRPRKNKDTLHNEAWIRGKYLDEKLSCNDIGMLLGCSGPSVKFALRKFGIKSRTNGEAKRNLFDRRGRKTIEMAEVIAAYGGRCDCCGETEPAFLTLDHKDGGGAEHRRRLGTNHVRKIRSELKSAGWPKDKFRLLCMNCNFATRHGKVCPHQLNKTIFTPTGT